LSRIEHGTEGSRELTVRNEIASGDAPRFCLLTAPGRGAIAVIRIWGPGAIELIREVFRPDGDIPFDRVLPGQLKLGHIGARSGDQVVAAILQTGVTAVELQTHGGRAAVSLVLEALQQAGAKRSEHWELAGLDYAQGDGFARQAIENLPLAPTLLTAEILLDQAQGALRAEIARLADLVASNSAGARTGLNTLIDRGTVGLRLLSGWKVVLIGRPNVGKSRLLNALCGFRRVIVDELPGTTRDVVAFRTAFGGWPVELADTAGMRATPDEVEHLGVARAREELQTADLVLLVLDRSECLRTIDLQLIESAAGSLRIANKSDLPAAWSVEDPGLNELGAVTVSAERGDGLDELVSAIERRLVPDPPRPGEAVPFRHEQVEALGRARHSLLTGRPGATVELLRSLLEDSIPF
jgi:tRNA modification GTPase